MFSLRSGCARSRSLSVLLGLICLAALEGSPALAFAGPPSTGLGRPEGEPLPDPLAGKAASAQLITFSEFPLGTQIRTQYASRGVIFGGDSPFITSDSCNRTSPVLSGSPLFEGAIEGTFVSPNDGQTPITVSEFSLDAGCFDALRSVRLEWFDRQGRKIGQRTGTQRGIERITVTGGNIARFRIEIIENEPAGYAIDNLTFDPTIRASVLFRESQDGKKDGTWALSSDEVPGFDHTALQLDGLVYESHPGYPAGTYTDPTGQERRRVATVRGVQSVHSRGTFEHDAMPGRPSPKLDFEEVSIDRGLAQRMQGRIQQKIDQHAGFLYLDFSSLEAIATTLAPARQKGADNNFTCVGLVEWAAESAGHNGGEGFVPARFESFPLVSSLRPFRVIQIPLLSPQLLNYSMLFGDAVGSARQWLQGLLDPVDFLVVDPLGRRLGYRAGVGEINEIPGAFFSGDGKVEQYFIPNPLPGPYRVDLFGLGQRVNAGLQSATGGRMIQQMLGAGERMAVDLMVDTVPGGRGDLDGDGDIDSRDANLLGARLNTFTNAFNDPADLDGDGVITDRDSELLEGACSRPGCVRGEVTAACTPGSTTLCLGGGRFKLEMTWKTPQGQQGSGHAVAVNRDSGYFWFFDANNAEVIVKVINGCAVNSRYWVFAAGLTAVETQLVVTDTVRGVTRRFTNTQGVPFQPLQDAGAFETCP
ncbi:MAG TPA: dockerin type I domain-containing protein [Thermoanaerobaculia bacterium]|nr:dockerin type I domain-containing protein [Thermoanaerobaculia bacterium]